ncbi:protein chiffon [Neocloeon triangulifer]|uniref:protein chiffon n=1 Tax=Neocloeon triangulifer TaxID=2078957 RepID=UPI00286F56D3|nr:protein chiffon [Neocloeon triangulifer]
MVSPSKKRKFDSKTLTKPINNIKTGDLKIKRTARPLVDYRFYLDLKNHATAAKIETRLKTLGAVVDDFLAKEVKYVVSDRPEWTAEGRLTCALGQWPSALTASPIVAAEEGRRRAQKSRADAMLEKAKLQHTNLSSVDPLENASRWGIPIWPLEKLSKWLEKIENSLQTNVPTLRIRPFKGPFIKIEDINKRYRPLYGSLASWPSINLDYGCPFSTPKLVPGKVEHSRNAPKAGNCQQGEQRMTRKSRVPKPEEKAKAPEVLYPGYCEICEVDYVDLKQHLLSSTHITYTEDLSNYEDLDNLIKQSSTVEELLKSSQPRRSPRVAVAPGPQDQTDEKEMRKLPIPLCNGQLRRSSLRQAENKAKKESSETNGKKDDFIHNLRKRYPDSCCQRRLRSRNSEDSGQDSSDEMGGAESKPKTEELNGKTHSSEEESSCSSGRVIKRKRLSVEEKLLEDNKEYYKLEVKNAKLRSSGFLCQINKVEYDDECANHVPSTPLAEQLSSIKEEADNPKRRRTCHETAKTDHVPECAEDLHFSFETEPFSEPWFSTYQRQDDLCEFLEGFDDFRFRKRLVLPYEMPEFQRATASKSRTKFAAQRKKYTARSRAMQLVADAKNPRKSPRCHASTLAILSNLVGRRRRSFGVSPESTETVSAPPEITAENVDKTLDEMLASPATPDVSPTGRVRRKSTRRALADEGAEGDDLAAELARTAPLDAVAFKSELDPLRLVEDFHNCRCTQDIKPIFTVQPPAPEEEQPILTQPELLGLLARNKRRLESVSECSTMDTLSETGTNNSSSRGRFKKRKRNLTGWPSNKPRKRQAKPALPEENYVGVALKVLQTKGTKELKVKPVVGKKSATPSPKRRARTESPKKASGNSGPSGAQTSPVRKMVNKKRTCRARTRNSTSLRMRR